MRASQRRKLTKKKWESVYKLYCPDNGLRFICHYCGLAAPELDHVPPLSKIEGLLGIGYSRSDMDFFKIPCCGECNKLAFDFPHVRLSERFWYVKEKLLKKYQHKLMAKKWSAEELRELDFSLRVYVTAHQEFGQFLNSRILHGLKDEEEAKERLGISVEEYPWYR